MAEKHSSGPVGPTVVAYAVEHTAVSESNAVRQADHIAMFGRIVIAENVSMVEDCNVHLRDQDSYFLLQYCWVGVVWSPSPTRLHQGAVQAEQ